MIEVNIRVKPSKSPLDVTSPRESERIEQYLFSRTNSCYNYREQYKWTKLFLFISRIRAMEARLAHNQKATGSSPVSAISTE